MILTVIDMSGFFPNKADIIEINKSIRIKMPPHVTQAVFVLPVLFVTKDDVTCIVIILGIMLLLITTYIFHTLRLPITYYLVKCTNTSTYI